MIEAMISGRVFGSPRQRNGKNGKPYATVKLWAPNFEGRLMFVSVIAFNEDSFYAITNLKEGDVVSVVGPLKVGIWTDDKGVSHPSIDLEAIRVNGLHYIH